MRFPHSEYFLGIISTAVHLGCVLVLSPGAGHALCPIATASGTVLCCISAAGHP